MYGVDLDKPEYHRRGLRFYCSNRYSNLGCGRTFSIHFNTLIPYQTVNASYLSTFFSRLLKSDSIHQAWNESLVPFSLRCAYRWVKKFTLNLSNLRHKLHRMPKKPSIGESNIEHETITMLRETYKLSPNYLAEAQLKLQLPILHSLVASS